DDVARRARLSKGGVYAHFRSKDEIFEALIRRSLQKPKFDRTRLMSAAASSGRALVEELIDGIYRILAEPGVVETFRLLIAESN
ncbi:TetR/AcrR family transcriptional regulator; helix-turn-helix transcriptional regulator, partial [Mycobacterium tuberculosis]|nr:TetR/AcrR family transcriptional regulator; helix-turn-helix transcriptional regulator [Mycobacterium tuberculosis]